MQLLWWCKYTKSTLKKTSMPLSCILECGYLVSWTRTGVAGFSVERGKSWFKGVFKASLFAQHRWLAGDAFWQQNAILVCVVWVQQGDSGPGLERWLGREHSARTICELEVNTWWRAAVWGCSRPGSLPWQCDTENPFRILWSAFLLIKLI